MNDSLRIRRILVATDGSEPSVEAARYAAEIARCTGAEVVVLNAAEVSGVTQFVTYSVSASADLPRRLRETGASLVERTKEPLQEAGVPVHTKVIEGYAPEVILSEAEAGAYDLIAMGSCGAGTGVLRRMMLGIGSVAERVLAGAPCPVLVVRGRQTNNQSQAQDRRLSAQGE